MNQLSSLLNNFAINSLLRFWQGHELRCFLMKNEMKNEEW